jgi:hypothetical protein
VSMYSRVPVFSSHTIGVGGGNEPQSSTIAFLSGGVASNQQAVAIDPSVLLSVRNLFRMVCRESEGGGMKSQERRTKSSEIRLEKCRRRAHVPVLLSGDSS